MKLHTKKEFKEIQDDRIVKFLKDMNIEWEISKHDGTFNFEIEYACISEYVHTTFPDFIKHILERTYTTGRGDMFHLLDYRIHLAVNDSII